MIPSLIALPIKKLLNGRMLIDAKISNNDSHPRSKRVYLTIVTILRHLETFTPPTLQDIRPVNGSNDEIFLDEDAEMNDDEYEDEDGDKDNKSKHGCAKSMLVNLLTWLSTTEIDFESWETKQALCTIFAMWSFPMKNVLKLNWIIYFKVSFNLFYLIIVGFYFDVGKQTDNNNNNDLRNRHCGPKTSNTILQLKSFNPTIAQSSSMETTGVIKCIGYSPFSKGKVIGIELDLFF
ncbi:hypothetical protein RFI_06033 [Reticulomyxa filosa]|uniref:Uncharacterized protein n=1 Tax=Reticulomyxa filosa TaxID=46433 RepID=X6NYX6_RETFI|nr:hypothetical protein RFI_06033 [Reticulomyxa filosa]|eukprot:ETO31088.1 hypothetical protein RFI_06033 [Reticulomyxa filosa]